MSDSYAHRMKRDFAKAIAARVITTLAIVALALLVTEDLLEVVFHVF